MQLTVQLKLNSENLKTASVFIAMSDHIIYLSWKIVGCEQQKDHMYNRLLNQGISNLGEILADKKAFQVTF